MDLTALSITARKAIVLLALGIIAFIVIRIVVGVVVNFVKSLNPPSPPAATKIFGTLAPIKFDQPVTPSSKFTYTLETIDSQLPTLPSILEVYTTRQSPSLFQSVNQGKIRAKGFGFSAEPAQVSANIYQWQDPTQVGYTFTMDVVSGDFRLILDPTQRGELLTNRLNFDSTEAINRARTYLKNTQSFSPSFENGDSQLQFLNITPKGITKVNSAGQANSYRVDFFPSKINDKYPIMSQNPQSDLLNVTLLASSQFSREHVFELNYQQFEIDLDGSGTYDIKSAQLAWEELKNGSGIVVKNSKLGGSIAINSIYLGYFKESKTKYLKPVYVFEGTSSVDLINNDFTAILPAIAVENKAE